MDDKQDRATVKWTQANDATLLHVLADEKSKSNWGNNNPKKVAWTACERALADSERQSGGTPKTIQAIKNRWQRLKQEYDIVKEIRGLSGFGWDPVLCTVTAERDVWDAYIKTLSANKAKLVKKFQSKPFPSYNAIGDLVDGTRATGEGAFRAGQMSAFDPPKSPARASSPNDFAIDPFLEDISRDMERERVSEDRTGTQNTLVRPWNKEPGASFFGSDTYSTSEDEPTTPIPPPSKRKRSKSTAPPNEHRKACRISAGQGMTAMAGSLSEMADVMRSKREAKTRKEPATSKLPEDPQERAIAILETDATLSENELMDAVEYFMTDRDVARAYATLQTSQRRTAFLRRRLDRLREDSL